MSEGGRDSNGLSVLKERLDHVINSQRRSEEKLDHIDRELRYKFITRDEFNRFADSVVVKDGEYWLVRTLVFGLVGLVLIATVGALLAQVFR